MLSCCMYLDPVLNPKKRSRVITKCIKTLQKHQHKFEAIAVSGYSMALIAPSVADALGKNIVVVRKSEEDCHSHFKVEGDIDCKYIIIDDLIYDGDTVSHIIKKLCYSSDKSECVGVYLYSPNEGKYTTNAAIQEKFGIPLLG